MGNGGSSTSGQDELFGGLLESANCCCTITEENEVLQKRGGQKIPPIRAAAGAPSGGSMPPRWDSPTLQPGAAARARRLSGESLQAPHPILSPDQKAKIVLEKKKQGVLWTKDPWSKQWAQRWCTVTGDHIGMFECEKDRSEGDHVPKATIDISGCVIKTLDHHTQSGGGHKTGSKFHHATAVSVEDRLWRFQVVDKHHKDKLFEVGCEHEEDRAGWIQNILLRRAACRSLDSSPAPPSQ